MAFSHDVKDELVRVENRKPCCAEAEVLAALVVAAHVTPDGILFNTSHPGYAERLAHQLERLSGTTPVVRRDSGHIRVAAEDPTGCLRILDVLSRYGFDPRSHATDPGVFSAVCCRRAALRGAFLAGGSVGEPDRGYHLEIVSRHEAAIRLVDRLMRMEGIRPRQGFRAPFHIAYLKDGGRISDFLRATGAHGALLDFENLRVEKDVRNTVNRVVNCDTANSTRVAAASARQLELLRALEEAGTLGSLPQDLREAAQVRLMYPGLSIRDLGERLSPPLGKSGMSHRLRRLERMAEELAESPGKQA